MYVETKWKKCACCGGTRREQDTEPCAHALADVVTENGITEFWCPRCGKGWPVTASGKVDPAVLKEPILICSDARQCADLKVTRIKAIAQHGECKALRQRSIPENL